MPQLQRVNKEFCNKFIKQTAITLKSSQVVVVGGIKQQQEKKSRKTPEGKALDNLENWFNKNGVYWVRVLEASAMGAPDYVACIDGRFVSIECKSDKGRFRHQQVDNLLATLEAGGISWVVRGEVDHEELDRARKEISGL